ncbi:MAG: PKD domain-containing protein [Methanomicrobiales archaeon]|nr:PKD domain-containing protein [Methanomicrobiales archaeon]
MENETALARNILLALILSVVIIVVVILVVFIAFPPAPDIMPSFRANTERSGTTVYLYHDGGDPLQERTTRILINGKEVPGSAVIFLHGQDWPWTTGETIQVSFTGPGTPETVEVRYVSGDTSVPVYSADLAQPTVPPATVPSATPPSTAPPTVITPAPTTVAATVTITALPVTTTPGGPVPRPPAAAFQGEPRSGDVPLTVRFTDLSTGSPSSWIWNFGDGGTSSERNPVHEYGMPGIYSVTLTVTNEYGTSSKTEPAYIAAGMLPAAQFIGSPREGQAPLMVQFSDLSTGSPDRWAWNFGDATGSVEKNPAHLYLEPGEYSVALTVSNNYGANTRIQTSFVRVIAIERNEIFLSGSTYGSLLPGAYLQFVVTGPGAWIKIAGSEYRFSEGDFVQLFPGDVSRGTIDVNEAGITAFSFSDVRMFVNGDLARTGIVSGILVPESGGLKSTLTIVLPAEESGRVLFIDEKKIADGIPVTISNLGPGSDGKMYLAVKIQDLTFRGGAESFRAG